MKMNNIIKGAAVLLAGAVAMTGCIKETFPEGGYALPEQIQDSPFAADGMVASIPTALVTNYLGVGEHFDYGYPGIFGALDHLAGDMIPVAQNMPGGNQYYDRFQMFMYHETTALSAASGWSTFFWTNYYQFIKATNDVIGTAGDSEFMKEARGVAKTFRALYYLDLARMYDPLPAKSELTNYESEVQKVQGLTVPLVTESSTLEELKNNPRLPREEMFAFILADLDDAEECLDGFYPDSKNLPSIAVVYGMKARTYLWLGGYTESYADVPTGNDAYKLAAEYARKAINASGAQMLTQAQYLDKTNGFNSASSPSWMWAMMQSSSTMLNNLLSWSAHMCLDGLWGYGRLAQFGILNSIYDRMQPTDWRRMSFVAPGATYEDYAAYTNQSRADWYDLNGEFGVEVAPYANMKFKPGQGETQDYNVGNITDVPMMRVEEMYLIEAEALAHYDTGSAASAIKTFMAARGVSSYNPPSGSDALVEEIVFQKRIELWGEGQIVYDLKRLNYGMHNGDPGNNAPSGAKFTTDGRAPWWNLTIPLSAVQQNLALENGEKNNPDPSKSYKSRE